MPAEWGASAGQEPDSLSPGASQPAGHTSPTWAEAQQLHKNPHVEANATLGVGTSPLHIRIVTRKESTRSQGCASMSNEPPWPRHKVTSLRKYCWSFVPGVGDTVATDPLGPALTGLGAEHGALFVPGFPACTRGRPTQSQGQRQVRRLGLAFWYLKSLE